MRICTPDKSGPARGTSDEEVDGLLRATLVRLLGTFAKDDPEIAAVAQRPGGPRGTQAFLSTRCSTSRSVDEIGDPKKSSGHYKVSKSVLLTLYSV